MIFCKDSINTERAGMEKMKDEDLTVCEPALPAPEAPSSSLLNDLKYCPSGEYWNSEFARLFLLCFTIKFVN